jgi:hypothetical protein
MKTLLIVALLLAPVAYADTVLPGSCSDPNDCIGPITDTFLAGTVKSPGDTFTYDLNVQSFTNNGEGEAIFNGTVLAKGRDAGLTTYSAEYFFFPADGSAVLATFGNWEVMATVSGASVVDPPVATPEPSVAILCLAGLLALAAKKSKEQAA